MCIRDRLWTEHESAALVFGGAVVLSRPDTGAQRAIEPRSGKQLWAMPGEGPTQTLAMQGTEDLVNLVAGKASIVNARTGAVTSMSAPGERLVAAFNGNVFTTRGATLIAIRAGQASREIYTGTGELYGQPVQCQRTLICFVERRTTGQVVAVDPATAREVWRLDAGAPNATLTSDGTHAVIADRTGSRFVLEGPKMTFAPAIIRFAWAGHAIALGQARGSAFYNPEIPMKVSGLDLGAMTAVDLGELPAGTCGVGATVLVCLGDETITTWRFAV